MTDWEVVQVLQAAAKVGMQFAAANCRDNGIMPAKIRVSIWAKKEDGSGFTSSEFDAIIDPVAYEESYQEYQRRLKASQTEISKAEVFNELHDFLDSLNDISAPKKGDDQDPDEATKGDSE